MNWSVDIRLVALAAGIIVIAHATLFVWDHRWQFDGSGVRICSSPDGVHLSCTTMPPGTRDRRAR
jgi:hypothetical protein